MTLATLLLILGSGLSAQSELLLKPHRSRPTRSFSSLERRVGSYRHWLIQFANPPSGQQLRAIEDHGGRFAGFVPPTGYIVGAPEWINPASFGAAHARLRSAEDKLSYWLDDVASDQQTYVLVEFYPDVDMDYARTIVTQDQLQVIENPDLILNHLLVSGTDDAIEQLAAWDEVAYIFPAAAELVQGIPMNGCAGALAVAGPVGQMIPTVGGWAPVGGAVDLTYAFGALSAQLDPDATRSEIQRALNEWSKYVKVGFTQTTDLAAPRSVTVMFASGDHGDGYPFTSQVLAHTFYPAPMNPEPIAGDLHLNADQPWQIGAGTDLYSVALHEIGHALGLGHSDQPGAVMYPYYRGNTTLTKDDISAIQTLYAARDSSQPQPPAAAPVTLTVTNPGSTTTASSIALNGSALGGIGTLRITWIANGSASGTASGSATWSIPSIPLNIGNNTIVVTATDSQDATASQQITITRQTTVTTPPPAPGPVLSILSPSANGVFTSATATISVSGTASDVSGISRVAWNTTQNQSGLATGTSNWTAGPITLAAGNTTVSVTVYAQDGQSTSASIQLTYAPPAPPPTPTPTPTPAPSGNAPPTMSIVSPATTTLSTSQSSIAVSGTASSAAGIGSVTWETSNGDLGTAAGTVNWSIPAIPLYVGTTTITIRAHDTAGNTAWRSMVVTRN